MDHSEIRSLRAFLVLMAERGVSKAGDRRGLSQPAMSHVLGRLRELFHDPLLLRSGNTMVPTARAVEIEDAVSRLIAEYDRLIEPIDGFDCATSARTFSISAPEFAERLLVPPLLRKVARPRRTSASWCGRRTPSDRWRCWRAATSICGSPG